MTEGLTKDSYTIGEVVTRLKPEFPTLSVSKIRYLERRRLINLSRTRGGETVFSNPDSAPLGVISTRPKQEEPPAQGVKKTTAGGAPPPTTHSSGDGSRGRQARA